MYYDDQARRFNVLSGLLSGAVLGAGIALLLRPEPGTGARLRRGAGRLGRRTAHRLEDLRDGLRA